MADKVKIVVRTGAQIIEVTEGKRVQAIRTVGRSQIITRGEYLGDGVWEFNFQGRNWTVDAAYVQEVTP